MDISQGRPEHAWYVIHVLGAMDPAFATWFEGLEVRRDSSGNTVISGEVIDRAAFYGLISRARDLGLTITAIERLERADSPKER